MKTAFWKADWFFGLVITIALFGFARVSGVIPGLERWAYDLGVKMSSKTPSDKVAIIAIDDQRTELHGAGVADVFHQAIEPVTLEAVNVTIDDVETIDHCSAVTFTFEMRKNAFAPIARKPNLPTVGIGPGSLCGSVNSAPRSPFTSTQQCGPCLQIFT